jgi:carotenoid cleavage dioxygenase-like enzyme
MALPTEHRHDETIVTDLEVLGTLPEALSGQYLRIGPRPTDDLSHRSGWPGPEGQVHAIALHRGRAVSYRTRAVRAEPAGHKLGSEQPSWSRRSVRNTLTTNLVAYAGTILALADGALAYELTTDLQTVRRVDLAGGARAIGAHPKTDPATGELHLLSSPGQTSCGHHVVSPGGLTRRSRSISAAPLPVHDLAITRERVLLVADGLLGVTDRHGDDRITWVPAGITRADQLVSAYDDGETVVIHVVGHTVRRLVIDVSTGRADAKTLDPTPQRFGRINERLALSRHRFLYTVPAGDATSIHKHDLVAGTRERHEFGAGRAPGEFLFVEDPLRATAEDGGWLLGLVNDAAGAAPTTRLVVLDAARFTGPAVATVTIPHPVPPGFHGLWVPTDRSIPPASTTKEQT